MPDKNGKNGININQYISNVLLKLSLWFTFMIKTSSIITIPNITHNIMIVLLTELFLSTVLRVNQI
jgi:hypothetical protein